MERAGLDFKTTALLFTTPGQTQEEKETGAAFKVLAGRTHLHAADPVLGSVIAILAFVDLIGYNPHCHIVVMDGCFYGSGMFRVASSLDLKILEAIFLHEFFKVLLTKAYTCEKACVSFCYPQIGNLDKNA